MSALNARRTRLLAALYRQFGEGAAWRVGGVGADILCVVRRKSEDMDVRFGESEGLLSSNLVKVRRSEVSTPAEGDTLKVQLAEGGELELEVVGDPRRVKNGLEWVCEVREVA